MELGNEVIENYMYACTHVITHTQYYNVVSCLATKAFIGKLLVTGGPWAKKMHVLQL